MQDQLAQCPREFALMRLRQLRLFYRLRLEVAISTQLPVGLAEFAHARCTFCVVSVHDVNIERL